MAEMLAVEDSGLEDSPCPNGNAVELLGPFQPQIGQRPKLRDGCEGLFQCLETILVGLAYSKCRYQLQLDLVVGC